MDNIKYYKFGLDKYINQFESDKNSGLYEYRLILNELQKIDLYAKNGTLVVLNGLMTDKSIKDVELLIKNAHAKGAKAIYIVTDEIAFSNMELINKFDLVLHQAWRYDFEEIKCRQAYSYVPELFFTGEIDKPQYQHNLVFFCGNDKNRKDKIKQYLRDNGLCNLSTFSLIKTDDVDERIEHTEYLKIQKMFKYSLMICRKSYRECGWITARLIEAIDCWSYPIFDIDYDINLAYANNDFVCSWSDMFDCLRKKENQRIGNLLTLRVKANERKEKFKEQILEFVK